MTKVSYKILQTTKEMECQVILGACSEAHALNQFQEHLKAYPNRVQLLVRITEPEPLTEVIAEGGFK